MTIVGGIYEHYKGEQYKVIGLGRMEHTLEELVIFKPLTNTGQLPQDTYRVRPRKEWERPAEINGNTVPRYILLKTN